MIEDYIIPGIFCVIFVEYFWDLYLSLRQHNVYKKTRSVPKELTDSITKETFDKSRLYALDKSNFSLVKGIYAIIISVATIWFFVIFHLWSFSKIILANFTTTKSELAISAVFMVLLMTINVFTSLPISIYNTFVLEEKHGFNKQTVGFFIKDQIKAYLVSTIIAVPLTCAAIFIIQAGGDYFFIYLWLFSMLVLLFLMTVYPDYIAPLFDKYTPLPDGELRTKIEELAASLKFPLYKLYLVEGSKRSVHSNAYFYGFLKNKRIVLFDTLLKKQSKSDENDSESKGEEKDSDSKGEEKGCDDNEILAVLSHEFGHWKYNHVFKNIVIMQVNLFFQFFAFGFLSKYSELFKAFNFTDEQPTIIGLIIVLQVIFSPYHSITSYLLTILSRKFEFQADLFAKSLGKAVYLRKALIKLHTDNLSFPVYDWLYSSWHHSHPPLLQRLDALKKED